MILLYKSNFNESNFPIQGERLLLTYLLFTYYLTKFSIHYYDKKMFALTEVRLNKLKFMILSGNLLCCLLLKHISLAG